MNVGITDDVQLDATKGYLVAGPGKKIKLAP